MLGVALYFEDYTSSTPRCRIGFFTLLPLGEVLPFDARSSESLIYRHVKGPVEDVVVQSPYTHVTEKSRDLAEAFAEKLGLPYLGLRHNGQNYTGPPIADIEILVNSQYELYEPTKDK